MIEGRVRTRPLGGTGIEVSEIGLGCGNWGREIDEESSNRLMDYAVERGITLFDTGEAYGGGESYETRKRVYGTDDVREASLEKGSSERIIGTWMRKNGCRGDITVMSKFNSGASADNIPRALSGSLGRLDTDFVDIYLLHIPDPAVPVAETVDALSAEVDAGRVGVMGCSNHSAAQVREALDASDLGGHRRYGVLQTAYSLAWPDTEREALPLCEAEGLGVTAFSPLGAGFLTGKYTPDRQLSGGLQVPYNARARRHLLHRSQLRAAGEAGRQGAGAWRAAGQAGDGVGDDTSRRVHGAGRRPHDGADR